MPLFKYLRRRGMYGPAWNLPRNMHLDEYGIFQYEVDFDPQESSYALLIRTRILRAGLGWDEHLGLTACRCENTSRTPRSKHLEKQISGRTTRKDPSGKMRLDELAWNMSI